MLRILIADDHELVRHAIVQFISLNPNIQVVAEASSGTDLLNKLQSAEIDLAVMDLHMPGISGAELVSCVREAYPLLRILVLSAYDDTHIISQVIRAGASGYIHKGCAPQSLIDAITKTATVGRYLQPAVAQRLAFDITTPASKDIHLILSGREMQVFKGIVGGRCIKEIAGELFVSEKTVSSHKAHLLAKLGLESVSDLVKYAIKNNLFEE